MSDQVDSDGGTQDAGDESAGADRRGTDRRSEQLGWAILVPALAALAGSAIGAIVTVVVTGQQLSAADRGALREQQQVAYATLLNSMNNYIDAINDYDAVALQPLPSDVAALDSAQDVLVQDVGGVLLLGGDEVRDRAVVAQSTLDALRDVVVGQDASSSPEDESEARADAASAHGTFIEAARDELT